MIKALFIEVAGQLQCLLSVILGKFSYYSYLKITGLNIRGKEN
jgi:hypothetical protein